MRERDSVRPSMHTGSCLCGRVRLEVEGELTAPDACHCRQCRKQSGHVFASTDILRDHLRVVAGEDAITWYRSSERVRRGFCSTCGSTLFWDPLGKPRIAVAMGLFDTPTRTALDKHIFVADQGDYYAICDDLPQHAR
jgi:hypothetical protein